ncbi:MAG: hypothetical protein ACLFP2_05710 [Candidatus Woesearchaeota archaeon]
MKTTAILEDGRELNISIEQDGGFISSITIEGPDFVVPVEQREQLAKALKYVQLNPVALYTRIRFFMLKNQVTFEGIDCNTLAEAISNAS